MPSYQLITTRDAQQRLLTENTKLVDIRDANSFESDHVSDAFHLTNDTVAEFIQQVDVNIPVFVICYHGNSSKGVAQYLCEQGYTNVYSVEGGFAEWRQAFPED